MKRRQVLRLLAGGGIIALGAACVPPAPSARVNPGTSIPQTPAAPRAGGTLRLGTLGDLASLDGHASGPFDTLYQVWDLLGVEDEKLELQPVLAESFEWSSDA